MVMGILGIINLLICAAVVATASRMEHVKVIIVGGGASGVAAAARLEEGGITDFLVVEAGEKLGGRLLETEFGTGMVELGAQYIHGEDGNVVYKLAKEWGMLAEEKYFQEEVLYNDGKEFDEELAGIFWEICLEIDMNMTPNFTSKYGSVGEYFEAEFNKKLEESNLSALEKRQTWDYLQYYDKAKSSNSASGSWFQLRIEDTWEECPGNQAGGFSSNYTYTDFLMKLGSHIEENVRLKEKVLSITEMDNGVVVQTDKKNYTCQYVVLTVSLGVLKHGDITFVPPLPSSKLEAIHNLGFGKIGKIFLEYTQPWAEINPNQNPDYQYTFLIRNESSWRDDPAGPWQDGVHNMVSDSRNPTVVTLWTIGNAAQKAALLPEQQLIQEADALLKKFLLSSIPNLPSPIAAVSPSWSTNPLVRGTYSLHSPTTLLGIREILAEPVGRILFAGEATNTIHYATVHGAIETGWTEADRIILSNQDEHHSDKIISKYNGGDKF